MPWNLAPGNEALMAEHAFDTLMAAWMAVALGPLSNVRVQIRLIGVAS